MLLINMKKPSYENYNDWLKKTHGIVINKTTVRDYNNITNKIKADFEKGNFWRVFIENLQEYHDEYYLREKYDLFMPYFKPEVKIKPFNSVLLKTYRKNILYNKNWPNEPNNGWIFPNNCYAQINDILRTIIVVKYLDGVEFIIEQLEMIVEDNGLILKKFFEAREEGYYAAHIYIKETFEILKSKKLETEEVEMSIEIQIATQIQEVLKELLHKYYDIKRKTINKNENKWQWDYKNEEFTVNYLGHMLHYVDGMIMDVREKEGSE